MTKDANKRQIGGDHYGLRSFQHWDMVEQYGMGYLEGCASKYLARWRKKGGVKDLQKADHYVQKLMEIDRDSSMGRVPLEVLKVFCESEGFDLGNSLEGKCLQILCHGWGPRYFGLGFVRDWLAELIEAEESKEQAVKENEKSGHYHYTAFEQAQQIASHEFPVLRKVLRSETEEPEEEEELPPGADPWGP